MSNIKLKDHYWEASGVFDKVQNKTQRELNSEISGKVDSSAVGAASGVASLDSSGKVPIGQLPVDSSLSGSSTNPVQNKVVKSALDNKAPVITDTASGSIASFPDGADGLPLHKLTVQIEPVQAAGTPTPESPLPISGWTAANVTRTGKNLLPSDSSEYQDGIINTEGIETAQGGYKFLKEYIPIFPNTVYTYSAKKNTPSNLALSIAFYDSYKNFLVRKFAWGPAATLGRVSGAVTSPQNAAYCRVNIWSLRTSGVDFQLELGSATDYEPYKGNTYEIPFSSPVPGIVYAAALEWIGDNKWKLKARPYYASYNGEALVGPWVSSMDVYASGTTPTTGAQAVDLGGAETEYIITIPNSDPATLPGINNIWADCGDVSVEYRADTKLYIDKKLAAIVAALS